MILKWSFLTEKSKRQNSVFNPTVKELPEQIQEKAAVAAAVTNFDLIKE